MARDAKRTSPPDQPGGDDARDLYDELTDDLLYDPAIGRSTMMGYPCVRLAGQFLASYDDQARCLVVKLPRERVAELVQAGTGDQFAPAGKVFREWIAIPAIDRQLWRTLLTEAVAFARKTSAKTGDSTTKRRPPRASRDHSRRRYGVSGEP